MIGTTAALLTAAAIGGGTQLAGAAIGSRAASNAAKTQQQAARQGYQQALQMQSPYLAVGNQALSTLGRLTAAPAGSMYAAPPVQNPYLNRTAVPRRYGAGNYPLSRLA